MSTTIKYINLHDQEMKLPSQEQESEGEEEEEAISLCDFPLNSNEPEKGILSPRSRRQSSSSHQPPSDFFEFFNESTPEEPYNMSHAEDIILCGKLVPFSFKNPNNPSQKSEPQEDDDSSSGIISSYSRRYCESLPETNDVVTRSNSTNSNNNSTRNNNTQLMMRSSRSLDYDKLRRNSSLVMKSEVSDIRRSLSKGTSVRKPLDDNQYVLKGSSSVNYKPSWYVLMFGGLVKVNQPEIDVRDMKLRQSRRSMSTMFPGIMDGDANIPATNRRSFWGHDLLKVLSCKSHSSVAFTEPSFVP